MDHQARPPVTDDEQVWQYEEMFWLNGAAFFRKHIDRKALVVLPEPLGIIMGEQILEHVSDMPRWEVVEFKERFCVGRDDSLVVAYRVAANRAGMDTYHARCSSSYVRRNGVWYLLSHQQTPMNASRRE
jgi:hypothetical protein